MSKIVWDPGHGGLDSGAVGPTGLCEKDAVLQIGLELEKIMQEEYVCEFRLTRRVDVYLAHQKRCDIANSFGADLFVSGHINAHSNPEANGFESYIWNGLPSGHRTEAVQEAIHIPVRNYADRIGIRDRGMKSANFYVLRNTRMSAVLLEYAFISNRKEERLLRNSSVITGFARATSEGIARALGLERKKTEPEKPEKEVFELNNIIVLGGDPDYFAAVPLAGRLNALIAPPGVTKELHKAKRIFVVGGKSDRIREAAPNSEVIVLSGENRHLTSYNVGEYLRGKGMYKKI